MRTRRRCPAHVQADTLIAQDNRCLYCGHRFGDLVVRKGNDWQWLQIEWDHFVPFAYSNRNPDDGWVAACHLCNRYKGDRIFEDIPAVRLYIMQAAIQNEHDPLPFWDTAEPVEPLALPVRPPTSEAMTAEEEEQRMSRAAARRRATERVRRTRSSASNVTVDEWLRLHGE